jgi:hypothetical protein
MNQAGGFQGTQPGNPVQATLQVVNVGVGLFPPNSNNASGDSVQAAISRAALPATVLITNAGKHAAGGRTVLDSMSGGDRNGYGGSAGGYDSLNSDLNGGQSLGSGGANQTEGPTSGESSFVEGSAPVTFPTLSSPNQFGG